MSATLSLFFRENNRASSKREVLKEDGSLNEDETIGSYVKKGFISIVVNELGVVDSNS